MNQADYDPERALWIPRWGRRGFLGLFGAALVETRIPGWIPGVPLTDSQVLQVKWHEMGRRTYYAGNLVQGYDDSSNIIYVGSIETKYTYSRKVVLGSWPARAFPVSFKRQRPHEANHPDR